MSPGFLPLLVVRGASFNQSNMDFRWTIDGVPVDLTNSVVRAKGVDKSGGTLFDLSTVNGGVTVVDGRIALHMTPQITESLWRDDPPKYRTQSPVHYYEVGQWELSVEFSAQNIAVLLLGPVAVTAGV